MAFCSTRALVQSMLDQCILAELDYPTTRDYIDGKITEWLPTHIEYADRLTRNAFLADTVSGQEGAWQFTPYDISVIHDSIVILNKMLLKITKGQVVPDAWFDNPKLKECGLDYKSIYGSAYWYKTGYFSVVYEQTGTMHVSTLDTVNGTLYGNFQKPSTSTLPTLETKVIGASDIANGTLVDDISSTGPLNFIIAPTLTKGESVSTTDPDLQYLYVCYNDTGYPADINSPNDGWYQGIATYDPRITSVKYGSYAIVCWGVSMVFGRLQAEILLDKEPVPVYSETNPHLILYYKCTDTRIIGVIDRASEGASRPKDFVKISGMFNCPTFQEVKSFAGARTYYYYDDAQYQPTPDTFMFYDNGRRYWYKDSNGKYVELELSSQEAYAAARSKYGTVYVSPTEGYMSVKSGLDYVTSQEEFDKYLSRYGRLYARDWQLFLHTYDPTYDVYEEFKKSQSISKLLYPTKFWRGRFGSKIDPRITDLESRRELAYISKYNWAAELPDYIKKFDKVVRYLDDGNTSVSHDALFAHIRYADSSSYRLLCQLGNIWAVRHELIKVYNHQLEHLLQEGNHGRELK